MFRKLLLLASVNPCKCKLQGAWKGSAGKDCLNPELPLGPGFGELDRLSHLSRGPKQAVPF